MVNTTLYPIADAGVYEGAPDNNYGGIPDLYVRTRDGQNARSFLKFNLSGLPAGVEITLATLRLNCYSILNLIPGITDVQARRTDDSWYEYGITWNNSRYMAQGAIEDTTPPAIGWVEWIITSFVQAEWAGDKIVSICLRCVQEWYDGATRNSSYRSREYNGDDPELYIEYIPSIDPPTVTTQDATDIAPGQGRLNGTITDTGGENCDTRGFDWDYNSGVPYAYNWTESGSFGVGSFSKLLTGLTPGAIVYFRVKAHNSGGWGYGSEKSFEVPIEIVPPTVTTQDADDIGIGSGTLHGTITSTGGIACSQRGFDWDYNSGIPYSYSWTESDGFGVGSFAKNLMGLTEGATVYFRAKAYNIAGWGYGSQRSFVVPAALSGASGGSLSWVWKGLYPDIDVVPDGGPASWLWKLFTETVTTPIGSPTSWSWQEVCPIECEIACQICGQTGFCLTECELECQTTCELSCQEECVSECKSCAELGMCEELCEVSCKTGCEVECKTCAELGLCLTGCEISCETTCELTCEECGKGGVCETMCEGECQVCSQAANCQSSCELECQAACQLNCKTTCELSCQTTCKELCQTSCMLECQPGDII